MNTIINIYILIITGLISHSRIVRQRIISGGLAGGLLACTVLLPHMNIFLSLLLKLFGCSLLVFISFEYTGINKFIRRYIAFIFVNCIFAGAVLFFGFVFDTPLIYFNNANFYFDISAPYLIAVSSLTYLLLKITLKRTGNTTDEKHLFELKIIKDDISVVCSALSDTGSSVKDVFSDMPVAIVEAGVVRKLLCSELMAFLTNDYFTDITPENKSEIRLIPYKAVSGGGYLKAFRCDALRIYDNDNSCFEVKKGYIAVYNGKLSNGEYSAIINPEIFEIAREVA